MQKLLLLSTSLHCTNAITHHSCTRPLFAHFHTQLVFARFLHHFTAPTPSLITAAHAPCSHTFTHSLCLLAFYITSPHQRHHSSQLHTPLVRTLSRTARVCSRFLHHFTTPAPSLITAVYTTHQILTHLRPSTHTRIICLLTLYVTTNCSTTHISLTAHHRHANAQDVSARFLRHFTMLSLPQPSETIMRHVFSTILGGFFDTFFTAGTLCDRRV